MTCCFKRRGILSCTLNACQKIGKCTLSTPISPFFLEWPSAEYTTYTWTYEHQYALCMIWDWLVCTAFKLLYKDLELNYPKTWFCIIWWLSNKMNITISLCLLEDFFFSQPLPLDLCGPHLSFSLLDTNRGAFFAWRAPILSWPRITCSQVRMLKFLEPSREMP